MATPRDNLVRVVDIEPIGLRSELHEDGSDGRTLFGHFAIFNQWTEINSPWEGNFRERIAPGAFERTIQERGSKIKVLYDHGKDPQLGNKPLGRIKTLREDDHGVYYEVELLDTPYVNEFILPAARAELLGASFRFSVADSGDTWERGDDGMDERTLTDMDLYEFGPVTFPAYDKATAGVRCGTDEFLDSLAKDPRFVARFTERAGLVVTERLIEALESLKIQQSMAHDDETYDERATDANKKKKKPEPDSPYGAKPDGTKPDDSGKPKSDGSKKPDSSKPDSSKPDGSKPDSSKPKPSDKPSDTQKPKDGEKPGDASKPKPDDKPSSDKTGSDKPYGDVEYADPGYQGDGKKRYPLDTADHVKAAWSYINMPKNAGMYSADDLAKIKAKIKSAAAKLGVNIAEGQKSAEVSTDGQTSQPDRKQLLRRNYVALYGVGKKSRYDD